MPIVYIWIKGDNMIKIIKSREEFDSLLTGKRTLVMYGEKGNVKCKKQFAVLKGMTLDVPVYCTDIEAPGMTGYVGLERSKLPWLVVFEDRITKAMRQGLQDEKGVMGLIGS